ncbi:MAG TPA: OmpH family outer membrane protein [Candidatus Baltobacteraceae bacterium]|jgi:outer membrane protein|nr:OmpH family outer membrane protein [Candidatus Baltobacteraceae bacterium]
MKSRATIAILAAMMLTPAVRAQMAAGVPTKVGVINMQAAITGTAEGKQAAAELQSQFAPRQAELQTMQKQIEEDRTRLQTGQTTLSDEEQARLTREYNTLTRNLQRKSQEAQDDFNDAQQDLVNRIGRKMVDVLDKYAKDGGFAVVLDSSSQQTPIIYEANQVDITQDIIRLYDNAYPVKSTTSAAPSRPAPRSTTPKPQN